MPSRSGLKTASAIQGTAKSLALIRSGDRELPEQHGRHHRIARQPLRHPVGQGVKRDARGSERVDACDLAVGHRLQNEAAGHAAADVLRGALLEVAVEGLRARENVPRLCWPSGSVTNGGFTARRERDGDGA